MKLSHITLLISTALLLLCSAQAAAQEKIPVFVSILPQTFFVEQIGGNKVQVDALVQPGQSPATYAPTPRQMGKLNASRVFFRIGVPFENVFIPKIKEALPNLVIVDTREGISLQEMPEHEEEGHHNHHHEDGLDPHIWLDPLLVKKQAAVMKETLAQLDPGGRSYYQNNFETFAAKLDALHAELAQLLTPVRGKNFYVFHPSFGYFARAYGLRQVAVEMGGKTPSARHLVHLIEEIKETGVKVLFVQPQFSQKSAHTIATAIDGHLVTLDPLAKDYLSNMRSMAEAVLRVLQ